MDDRQPAKGPGTILVVEDSAVQAETLRRLLVGEGYDVTVARNGVEGYDRASAERPDLVLSDIMMPQMTGFELCRRIKDDPDLAVIPVILLTSLTDPHDVIKGLECRADNFLTKPYTERYLLSRIRYMLLSRELRGVESTRMGIEIYFGGQKYLINSDRQQILDLLLSTYETAVQKNRELVEVQEQLQLLNQGLETRVEERTADLRQEVAERKRAEEELRMLWHALEESPAAIVITDVSGAIEYVNPGFTSVSGYTLEELKGENPRRLKSGQTPPEVYQKLWSALRAGEDWQGEFCNRRKDGTLYWENAIISPIRDATGRTVRYIAIKEDITEQKNLQNQLRHAQKMEAIGQLAGGVAHDFNNILQTIIGFASIMQIKMDPADPLRGSLDQILAATDRATDLTRRLLAFSRKQVLQLQPVDLVDTLGQLEKFLSRILGEDLELELLVRDEALIVNADRGQVEQVLMNLATNARDAMPGGGLLSIRLERMAIDEEFVRTHGYGTTGAYALVSVSDSGCGMDSATLEHIFEPFFSTKGPEQGTGLGLAIVYGIVKQHQGFINVYSEPGRGTTFRIYLPLGAETNLVMESTLKPSKPLGGEETILLAEDEETIRELTRSILTEFGYTVLAAADGEEAVRQYEAHRDRIQLLLFDLIMPKMSGKEAYDRICQSGGKVKAVFVSGYPQEVVKKSGLLDHDFELVMKPVSPQNLLRIVRTVLDRD